MLMLSESTLFFINLMQTTPSSPNRKANAVAWVQQWSSRVQNDQQTTLRTLVGAPSISMAMDVPPTTIVSKTTQSTSATSLEDEDREMGLDEGHGGFGEDGNNALEREEALRATMKEKQVSPCQSI